uniref:Uncharacterized protein n=1 Tax=Octopus bimaculoides TaxID=37653 RepID=A0A0L8I5A6_OCTBM
MQSSLKIWPAATSVTATKFNNYVRLLHCIFINRYLIIKRNKIYWVKKILVNFKSTLKINTPKL